MHNVAMVLHLLLKRQSAGLARPPDDGLNIRPKIVEGW
jgi:hypothetical protein